MDNLKITRTALDEYEEKIITSEQKYIESGILTKPHYPASNIYNYCKLRKDIIRTDISKMEDKYKLLYYQYAHERILIQNKEIEKDLANFLCPDVMKNIMEFYEVETFINPFGYYSFNNIKNIGLEKFSLIIYRNNNDFPIHKYMDSDTDSDTDTNEFKIEYRKYEWNDF